MEKAGAAVVVCADSRGQEDISHEFQVDGCAAAAENMLLAAHALGLGGVWLGVCEGEDNCGSVKEALSIPDYAKLVCVLALGVPARPEPEPEEPRFAENLRGKQRQAASEQESQRREEEGRDGEFPDRWEPRKWYKECWEAAAEAVVDD